MAKQVELAIKFKKLHPTAPEPTRAYDYAAAWDLTATSVSVIDVGTYGYIQYGTGLALEIPYGYVGLIYPRSSVSETGLILSNSVGVVDPDYRGEIIFRFKWIKDTKRYEVGDRIGQIRFEKIIPVRWELTDNLSESARNTGAFGSSGK